MVNIADDTSFNELKTKRDTWLACFSLDDRNSIMNQVYDMVWNVAVFRLINEARRIAPDDAAGHKELNGTMHYFIDDCFFDSQMLAIRRLIDTYPLCGRGGVFSLRSLLEDMKSHASLMTRRNLFLAEGKEYDYESIRQRALNYGLEQVRSGRKAYCLPHDLDVEILKSRHRQIDELSGVKEYQRALDNTVREQIFDHLIKKIDSATSNIKTYAHTNVAHAATKENRNYKNTDQITVTLGSLWEAHKAICQVVHFVGLYILSEGHGIFLAVPQYSHLEFIDKPLVFTTGVEALRKTWDEFSRETHSWGQWEIENLQQEMARA